MPAVRNAPVRKAAVVVKPKPASVAGIKAKTPVTRASKAVIKKPIAKVASETVVSKVLVPNTPEAKKAGVTKRKRLSKAFSRPLDKKIKKAKLVRERFALLDVEYAHLIELKQRLSDQGVSVKKSTLMRVGLMLLVALDDAALKGILSKMPALD